MLARIILKDFSNFEAGRCYNSGHYGFWTEYSYIPCSGMWLKSYQTTAEFEYCSACGTFTTDHCSDESRCPWQQDCDDCGRLPCAHKVVSSEQALLEACHFIISSTKAGLWCEDSFLAIEVYFQDGQKREVVLAQKGWPDYDETETETRNLRELYSLLADSVQNLNCWSMSYNLDQQFLLEAARIYPWLDHESIDNTLSEAADELEEDADYYRSAIPKAKEAASILRQAIERELYNNLIGEEGRTSRIRRRVEDALRKGHPSEQIARRMLVKAALELEVRLD